MPRTRRSRRSRRSPLRRGRRAARQRARRARRRRQRRGLRGEARGRARGEEAGGGEACRVTQRRAGAGSARRSVPEPPSRPAWCSRAGAELRARRAGARRSHRRTRLRARDARGQRELDDALGDGGGVAVRGEQRADLLRHGQADKAVARRLVEYLLDDGLREPHVAHRLAAALVGRRGAAHEAAHAAARRALPLEHEAARKNEGALVVLQVQRKEAEAQREEEDEDANVLGRLVDAHEDVAPADAHEDERRDAAM